MSAERQDQDIDKVTGTATTGHVWDGIRELNTPLPRWWLWTFYLTIVWAIGYMIVYPAWPLISSHTRGLLGYSSRAEVAVELSNLNARRSELASGLATASLGEIKADPALLRVALARGRAAFGDNCVPCHGQGGTGGIGFPNLTDDKWLWGGKLEDIHTMLLHGARWSQDNRSKPGEMLAFGKTGVLKRGEIAEVVEYVRSLSKLDVLPTADLKKGEEIYAANCAACHGAGGVGNQELGAPSMNDNIWLYGSSRKVMNETVANGRAGIMPGWSGRLDPITIKALAVYVHSLGGGQ